MTSTERMAFLMTVYNTIFTSKAQGTNPETIRITHPNIVPSQYRQGQGRWFVNNTVRGFDIDLNIGNKVIQLRCMEQNPNKTNSKGNFSENAILAQKGHKIMWAIIRDGGFLGKIQDGVWHVSEQRAYGPQQPHVETGPASQDRLASEIPDINTEIPEYVLAYYAEHGDTEVPEE